MRRAVVVIATALLALIGSQTPATALSPPAPTLNVVATPNAVPPGNTFQVSGYCRQENASVTIELVRQARPGRAARVEQRRVVQLDADHGYSTTLANNLTTTPGFPVDAQVFVSCGPYTAHTPFVSTDLVYPNKTVRIVTVQADGTCGLCVAHVKGFDAFANLSTTYNYYLENWTRSASLAAQTFPEFTSVTWGTSPGPMARVGQPPFGLAPYGDFTGGVEFARQDIVGDEGAEIITGPGPGGGPHVRVFSGDGTLLSQFLAYAPNMIGGVSVAVGDVIPGGKQEIVTGAGPGGAAHVRTFDWTGRAIGNGFYAYDPSFTGGVWVAAGDVDSQGGDDIVTGAGAGGMPHVRVFTSPDGAFTSPGFYAYEDLPTGVRVAVPR